jgi:GNAT superfamily N-acetyltransferase
VTPDGLAALLRLALPDEQLSAEELAATVFEDPDGAVLDAAGGPGAVGVAVRGRTGFVTVIVVDPEVQRRGIGRALLDDAHAWLRGRGAATVVTGTSAPRYLWPGVDVAVHAAAVELFRSAGYEQVDATRNHRCSTTYRAPAPDGVEVRRVVDGSRDVEAVVAFAAGTFPDWVDELSRGIPNGCSHGAFLPDGTAVGFGCHSINRAGWIGPMATDPSMQGRGVGAALLGAVCRDLALAELEEAEIAWVGPDAFYQRTAGSTVSRRFAVLSRSL